MCVRKREREREFAGKLNGIYISISVSKLRHALFQQTFPTIHTYNEYKYLPRNTRRLVSKGEEREGSRSIPRTVVLSSRQFAGISFRFHRKFPNQSHRRRADILCRRSLRHLIVSERQRWRGATAPLFSLLGVYPQLNARAAPVPAPDKLWSSQRQYLLCHLALPPYNVLSLYDYWYSVYVVMMVYGKTLYKRRENTRRDFRALPILTMLHHAHVISCFP